MHYDPVVSREGRERSSRIIAAAQPVHAVSPDELEARDRMLPSTVPRLRCIGVVGDEDVLLVRSAMAYWYDAPGLFSVEVVCPDEHRGHFGPALVHACGWAADSGAVRLQTWAFSWQPWQAAFLQSQGWAPGQRNPMSVARPESFSGDAAASRAVVESCGLRLLNFSEWIAEQGRKRDPRGL